MKINSLTTIMFLLASLFFSSWVFWMPKYGDGGPVLLWSVSITVSFLGVMFTYGIIILLTFNPNPFTVKDDCLAIEQLKMFPPGITKIDFKYEWMNRFSYKTKSPHGDRGLSSEYFEIIPSHKAPDQFRKKRRVKFYIQGNYDGSPERIVDRVNHYLNGM